ncbi:hypothetical protein AB1L88_18860 [Tautonia sp. JC769]|uniref:hypothetical protein n=1 Tax=Tautonia sp. JC769 TaxID=3232135 RepID=UPI00345A91C0
MPRVEPLPPLGNIYNVSAEEYQVGVLPEEREDEDAFGDSIVWSVAELPPVGAQEQERRLLVPRLRDLITRFLIDVGLPEVNDVRRPVFGTFAIGESTDTRELGFYLDHPRAITPELIRRIQRLLAESFPLWRVNAMHEHLVLGIYPEGIRVGEFDDGFWKDDGLVHGTMTDDDPLYQKWVSRVREHHEHRYGPLRRQIAALEAMIPAARSVALRDGFTTLLGFDRHCHHVQGVPILWIVGDHDRLRSREDDLRINGESPEYAPVEEYKLLDDGTLRPNDSSQKRPRMIVQAYFPNRPAAHYEFSLSKADGSLLQHQIDRIITDEELLHRGFA